MPRLRKKKEKKKRKKKESKATSHSGSPLQWSLQKHAHYKEAHKNMLTTEKLAKTCSVWSECPLHTSQLHTNWCKIKQDKHQLWVYLQILEQTCSLKMFHRSFNPSASGWSDCVQLCHESIMYASTTGVDLVKLVSQGMEQSGYSSKKKKHNDPRRVLNK